MQDRDFYRHRFPNDTFAQIRIIQIDEKDTKSEFADVKIKDVSAGGISFYSFLDFHLKLKVIIEVKFKLLDRDFTLKGQIIRKSEIFDMKEFEYVAKFSLTLEQEENIVEQMHKLSIMNRK